MTLTPAQLRTLVAAIRELPEGERYAVMVDLMGSAGLRYGEAAASQVGDLDLARGVLTVQRSVSEMTKDDEDIAPGYWREGNLVWGPPKGGKSRIVPVPKHLVEPLRELTLGQRRTVQVFRSERTGYVIRGNVLKTKMMTEVQTEEGPKAVRGWGPFVAALGFDGCGCMTCELRRRPTYSVPEFHRTSCVTSSGTRASR